MAKENPVEKAGKTPDTKKKAVSLTNDEKIAAVLSYVHFLVLIPFFTDKEKNEFTRFHVKQGLVLFFTEVVVFFFVSYFKVFFWFLGVGFILGMSANVIYLIISAYSIFKAMQGEKWNIPLVSKLAERIELK